MKMFDFRDQFGQTRLGTVSEGIDHFKIILDFIDASASNETIIFDISAMEVFSHSYAKQTIVTAYERLIDGKFFNRHFLMKADSKEKLEDTARAFEKLGSAILATTSESIAHFYDQYFVIGPIQQNLADTLKLVIENKQITTSEVAKRLEISIQNASNRLRTLDEMKLINRSVDDERVGNLLSCERISV